MGNDFNYSTPYSVGIQTDPNAAGYASSLGSWGMGGNNTYTDMFNEWMQNNTSSALGNTGNVYPTPDQYEMFKKDGLNPITGEPLKPQSLADMTGLQKLSFGMDTIGNLANIWSGIQQNRLAKDNFNFQKGVMNTNLANQISSYNTALEDRVAGRYSDREREANQSQINDYLDRNRAVNKMA